MKLKINESLLIGGPKRSAKIEVDTNNKIFDIEIVSGYMSFSNTISGMSYTQINLTTTSSFNYKTWDILGTFTIKSNQTNIWDSATPKNSTWSKVGHVRLLNSDGEFIQGLIDEHKLINGQCDVYVKYDENNEVTDIVIDCHKVINEER